MALTGYDRVLAKLGKQKVLVELSGVRQSIVSGWAESGVIPIKRIPGIIERAQKKGYPLKAEDFLPERERQSA